MADKTIKVTLVKSVIGTKQDHRATVRGLGLRKLNSSAVLEDTPAVRGMIRKIAYLLKCEGEGDIAMSMELNNLKPGAGSKHASKRVGRGIGSGLGKTAGRGHKGQKSRAGGFHKVGFEGGQMPLQRRLPKRGFVSLTASRNVEVRLSELDKLPVEEVDLLVLKQAGVIAGDALSAKVILSGKLNRKIALKGVGATKGARAAIEAAGGSVADIAAA